MSTQSANTRRIPNPVYAAAGAGDLAYRELQKLPARAQEFRGRVAALRPVVADVVRDPAKQLDVDRLRVIAKRNAAVLRTQAKEAQERAADVYAQLVARGEKVVGGPYKPMRPAGDVVAVIEPEGLPSAETPGAAAKSGEGTGDSPARAVKRTKPTAVK
jgi:heparin binding hemagglutinin HbhA